jgi:crotonobetainyl-CoA:carnitine CoA-transferase CaiB-like acyl-CoA transferase
VKHLGLIEEVEHPKAGMLKFVGAPVRFDNLAKEEAKPPPLVGEQSAKILREFGYDEAIIKSLLTEGVGQVAD